MRPLLFLLLLIPVVVTAQRMEIAGISRGMTHQEVWRLLSDSTRWKKPYTPYDISDSYLPNAADSSELAHLQADAAGISMKRGKVESVLLTINVSGRDGVEGLPDRLENLWASCAAWTHGAPVMPANPKIPSVAELYRWEDGDKITLGTWKRGEDQLYLWMESMGVGYYRISVFLWKKGR